jgi:hypothetical protein
MVDHHDHNKLNNCRSNLHTCTRQENQRNVCKRAGSSSQFKGVGYSKKNHKWSAELVVDGIKIWLGYFTDEIEAARAYDRKAVELFGEFANLNFPEEWTPEQRQQAYAAAQPLRDALKAKADAKKGQSRKAKGKRAERKNARQRAGTPARKARKRPSPKAKRLTRKTKRNGRRPVNRR